MREHSVLDAAAEYQHKIVGLLKTVHKWPHNLRVTDQMFDLIKRGYPRTPPARVAALINAQCAQHTWREN